MLLFERRVLFLRVLIIVTGEKRRETGCVACVARRISHFFVRDVAFVVHKRRRMRRRVARRCRATRRRVFQIPCYLKFVIVVVIFVIVIVVVVVVVVIAVAFVVVVHVVAVVVVADVVGIVAPAAVAISPL